MKKLFQSKYRGIFLVVLIGVIIFGFFVAFGREDMAVDEDKEIINNNNGDEIDEIDEDRAENDRDSDNDQEGEEIEWSDTKTVTIELEGMPEEIEIKLYQNDDLGLVTYYPANMITVEEDNTVWFYYARDGEINDEAYVKILKDIDGNLDDYEPGRFFTENGWELVYEMEEELERYTWAERNLIFKNASLSRNAIVLPVKADDELFSIILQYQDEYGDGFYPRANIILENIYLTEKEEFLIDL